MDEEIYNKIVQRKEFSDLPRKDVELVFSKFDCENFSNEEKIKKTRDLLQKVFTSFASSKLLNLKNKDEEWILKRHSSSRERILFYEKIYKKLFFDFEKVSVFDLGAGVNGFSYNFMKKNLKELKYFAIEAIGQLVNLMNYYFKKNNFSATAFHLSLFDLEKIKKLIKSVKGKKIIFLFKTLDSLEKLKRNYSKIFLKELVFLGDRVVVSFSTKSLVKGSKFKVTRKWIEDFIKENFNVLDDFEFGQERFLVFENKKVL